MLRDQFIFPESSGQDANSKIDLTEAKERKNVEFAEDHRHEFCR